MNLITILKELGEEGKKRVRKFIESTCCEPEEGLDSWLRRD